MNNGTPRSWTFKSNGTKCLVALRTTVDGVTRFSVDKCMIGSYNQKLSKWIPDKDCMQAFGSVGITFSETIESNGVGDLKLTLAFGTTGTFECFRYTFLYSNMLIPLAVFKIVALSHRK